MPSLDSLPSPSSLISVPIPYTPARVSFSPVYAQNHLRSVRQFIPDVVPGGPFIMLGDQAVVAGQLGFDSKPILVLLDSGASESYLDELSLMHI